MIDAITLLHQYQRETKRIEHEGSFIEYIEVALSDIELANELAHEVLGRTLDELPPQTRKLLKLIGEMVERDCAQLKIKVNEYRFTRKQVRDVTGWGNTQLKVHLSRLEDMEFLALHSMSRSKAIVYELRFDGSVESDDPHLMGLIDVTALKNYGYDKQKSGVKKEKSVQGRPQVGTVSGVGRVEEITKNTEKNSSQIDLVEEIAKSAPLDKLNGGSYRTGSSSLAANAHSSHAMELL